MWDPWPGKLGEEREKKRKKKKTHVPLHWQITDTRPQYLFQNTARAPLSSANWPYLSTQHYSSNIHVPLTLTDGHD